MSSVKWIRICTDMINNKKIKRIRTMPEGNNIVLIWVFLIAQAGESNRNGGLFLTDTIPFTHEDLAVEFGFEIPVIQLALITLEKFSMIEVYDDVIYIKNWEEYQNSDGLEKIREQGRERAKRFREKQKQALLIEDSNVTDNVTLTQYNATEEELEQEEELDKEKEKEQEEELKKTRRVYSAEISEIVDYLNQVLDSNYQPTTKETQTLIKARFKEGRTVDDFKQVIDTKYAEWIGDEKTAAWLRPSTLFGNKFESYLNQKTVVRKNSEIKNQFLGQVMEDMKHEQTRNIKNISENQSSLPRFLPGSCE